MSGRIERAEAYVTRVKELEGQETELKLLLDERLDHIEILESALALACLGLAHGSGGKVIPQRWMEKLMEVATEAHAEGNDPVEAAVREMGYEAFEEVMRDRL